MRLRIRAVLLVAAASAAAAAGEEMALEVAPAATSVEFTLGGSLHTVHGKFRVKRGAVRFDPTTGKASGEVVVDATSGESGSGARDRRMHKSILESDRYPEIVLTPERVVGTVAPRGESRVEVQGTLRIHGTEHPVAWPVTVRVEESQITADLEFEVPYVKWGMKNPSTFMLRVSDKVAIHIRAVAHAAEGAPPTTGTGG
jgi:polyisoprenoid-binding protein YceI